MAFGISAAAWVGIAGAGATAYSAHSSHKAGKKAAKAQNAQLQFDMQRYQDWKDIYGDLQEDVGEYYKNLTGEEIVGRDLEQLQKSQQDYEKQLTQSLAQRGIDGSGIEGQLLAGSMYQTEMNKANVRATADQRAAEAKQGFLSLGLGQGNQIVGQMANDRANYSNTVLKNADTQSEYIGYGARQATEIIRNF